MSTLTSVLTVDPGDHTGWAFWEGDIFPRTGIVHLEHSEIGLEDPDRIHILGKLFRKLIATLNPKLVVIEGVNLWGGSAKSQASASRGDSFYLAKAIGAFTYIAKQSGAAVQYINVNQWKGQLPKEEVLRRIKLFNGLEYPNHIGDAVGIGMHLMGVL